LNTRVKKNLIKPGLGQYLGKHRIIWRPILGRRKITGFHTRREAWQGGVFKKEGALIGAKKVFTLRAATLFQQRDFHFEGRIQGGRLKPLL